jgi:predicted GNAT family N-acyltransferase
MTQCQWQSYSQLSITDLYTVLAALQQVFLLKQKCVYPDNGIMHIDMLR